MLIPTITYGFAIIYSFGKQGLLTQLFGRQFFDIYGFNGLLMGYVIYTLPISFMLIHNTMGYIDKKFMIVSRLMGDSPFQTFRMTILRPLPLSRPSSCALPTSGSRRRWAEALRWWQAFSIRKCWEACLTLETARWWR